MSKKVVFPSTTDRFNRRLTYGVLVGMPVFSAVVTGFGSGRSGWYVTVFISLFVWVIVWFFASLLPRRIVVTSDNILLCSPLRPKIISRKEIVKIRRFYPGELRGLWRKWGANGCYGHWGLHSCQGYPKLYVYARREPKDWILIRTRERNYAIAPDDGEAFLKSVQQSEQPASVQCMTPRDSEKSFASTTDCYNCGLTWGMILFILGMTGFVLYVSYLQPSKPGMPVLVTFVVCACILILGIVAVGSAMLPRRIVITPETIVLDSRISPKTILRSEIVQIRRFRLQELKGLWRKTGAQGVFGSLGWFGTSVYPKLYVYTRRRKRHWILVQTRDRNYAITPDEGEAFLKYIEGGSLNSAINS